MTDYKQTTLPSFSRLCGHASCSLVQVDIFQPVYVCVNFSDVAHGVVVPQLGLMQGLIHSHLVVIGLCKKIRDPDWMIYCGVGATQRLIMDLWIKTKKWVLGSVWNSWKSNKQNLSVNWWMIFLCVFYLIFTTVGIQTSTSLSLGCGKQGNVCPSVIRVRYQTNPSPSVLSTTPKVYSRACRATQRKASFFRPSWLEAKGQRYLRLWLLCSFCLAPPVEDRKWAWRELNTAPSRFSSLCGGYSHRKVKLSDIENVMILSAHSSGGHIWATSNFLTYMHVYLW